MFYNTIYAQSTNGLYLYLSKFRKENMNNLFIKNRGENVLIRNDVKFEYIKVEDTTR